HAAEQARAIDYDAVVLDLMLPGRSGFQVLREIRSRKPTLPVLVLTARDSVDDRVAGLDSGADDYMTKPFALAELSARLRGLLRAGLSFASYRVLARQLDDNATGRLIELTDGLHGYLRFDHGASTIASNQNDPDQTAFIQEATRYYQIYNADTGGLVVQSDA